MKIAIIGAGFTGLSAAHELIKKGHDITIFEKDSLPGGLAIGYREKGWNWSLEKHYHHWFTNDKFILSLAHEIGHDVLIKRPKTSVYVDGQIFQFDSPKDVLTFPKLSLMGRFRMAGVIGLIRYNPFWKPLEKINASTFLPKVMGKNPYKTIWEPLFVNKFGKYADDVSLAWFWARITKRTPSLAYPAGGFLEFAEHLSRIIQEKGGTIHFGTEVTELTDKNSTSITYKLQNGKTKTENFDRIIFTLPSFIFMKIAKDLPSKYTEKLVKLNSLGATNLVLRLKKPFLKDNTYWVSVCDKSSPVMAVVEHTNMMNKKNYNNEHLLYLGNYLPQDSPEFKMDKEDKFKII